MARYSRKYRFDTELGKVVEVTEDGVRLICDEISAGQEELKVPIEPSLNGTRRKSAARWPIHSEAMAVDIEDVRQAQSILAEHGVKTEYDRIGRPILRDQKHRKQHAEVMGFYDRNAGPGDPVPKHR
jgi:hypothetical protein